MRFYTKQHRFYCGVDLHTRKMYLCIVGHDGEIHLHRNLPTDAKEFLHAVRPFRENLVVAAECMFCWYWLADLCAAEGIEFVLGHALYMRAIHGGKAKNDKLDSEKIAVLLRGGMLPMAYVYPAEMRSTRDLLRRRMHLVRRRSEAIGHVQNTNSQYNLPLIERKLRYAANRQDVAEHFTDASARKNVEVDLVMLGHYDEQIQQLELYLEQNAKVHDPQMFYLLRSVPGVGKILALVLMYEIHDIRRFNRPGQFLSYARLVKCAHESAGKKHGTGGNKIGNAHLKWAFSEATCLIIRECEAAKALVARHEKKHGKGKALSILSAKLGRAVYHMLRRQQAFDIKRFFQN
jgi:transposase